MQSCLCNYYNLAYKLSNFLTNIAFGLLFDLCFNMYLHRYAPHWPSGSCANLKLSSRAGCCGSCTCYCCLSPYGACSGVAAAISGTLHCLNSSSAVPLCACVTLCMCFMDHLAGVEGSRARAF